MGRHRIGCAARTPLSGRRGEYLTVMAAAIRLDRHAGGYQHRSQRPQTQPSDRCDHRRHRRMRSKQEAPTLVGASPSGTASRLSVIMSSCAENYRGKPAAVCEPADNRIDDNRIDATGLSRALADWVRPEELENPRSRPDPQTPAMRRSRCPSFVCRLSSYLPTVPTHSHARCSAHTRRERCSVSASQVSYWLLVHPLLTTRLS